MVDRELGIGLAIVVVTVTLFVFLGVEVGLMPSAWGQPAPTSLPIPAGTAFGLGEQAGYRNVYWAGIPVQVTVDNESHLYRITGGWTSFGRTGVLVNLDDAPYALYPGTPQCIMPTGQPCPRLPDPFTYNGSLDVYLSIGNCGIPGWATPTLQPPVHCANVTVANPSVTYYLVFTASRPDIINVTQAFVLRELPLPMVGS